MLPSPHQPLNGVGRLPTVSALLLLLGCALLVSTTALGDEVIALSPHVSSDVVYNYSDTNFVASVNTDSMVIMDTSSTHLYVTMASYTVGYTSATRTNTVLINGSSSNSSATRPLHLTITDWQFLAGGSLKFMGHFAPGSTFDISSIRTVGIVPTTPILANDFSLWGSSFILKDFTCTITMPNTGMSVPCVLFEVLSLSNSNFTIMNQTNVITNYGYPITITSLEADNMSMLTISKSSLSVVNPQRTSLGLARVEGCRIHNSFVHFSDSTFMDPTYGYLTLFALSGLVDIQFSSIVIEMNSIPNFDSGRASSFEVNGWDDVVFQDNTLVIRDNVGGAISMYMYTSYVRDTRSYMNNISKNMFAISNNTGSYLEIEFSQLRHSTVQIMGNTFGCCSDSGSTNIYLEIDAGSESDETTNITFIVSKNTFKVMPDGSTINIYTYGPIRSSKFDFTMNEYIMGSYETGLSIEIVSLIDYSIFNFSNNIYRSEAGVSLMRGGRFDVGSLSNNSMFLIDSNTFENFANFEVHFDFEATLSGNSKISITNNNFTGELSPLESPMPNFEGAFTLTGTRVVLHDHSSININYNTVNYKSTSLEYFIRNGISTCITPILSHFSHFDVSHNTIDMDTVVIPQLPVYGMGIESCSSSPMIIPMEDKVLLTRKLNVQQQQHHHEKKKKKSVQVRKQQPQLAMGPSSEDYSAEVNPEALADRCDIPIDYNDLHTNPGMPIDVNDLPFESNRWGVILLAASKMTIDNNTVMIRGHAHYDEMNNGPVSGAAFITSLALPDSVRITAGSSTTSRNNHVINNITMYPSFELAAVSYTAVGITSTSSMWIGDNGIADVSDNYVMVSSPFTVWGMNNNIVSAGTSMDEPLEPFPPLEPPAEEVRSRKMKPMLTTPPSTAYPTLNMPEYDDFDQTLTTTVTVVGCNSSYNINRNMVNVSGIVGTGGIALSPSKIGVSTAGVLSIVANEIKPVWVGDIPDYLEEPFPETPTAYPTTTTTTPPPAAAKARDFKVAEVDQSNPWFSIGIAVGGNPTSGGDDAPPVEDEIIIMESRTMKQQLVTKDDTSSSQPTTTTKALYNGTINVSNNNIYLSRHTDPTIAGSEGGILCVGDLWMRSSSKLNIEMNTIRMDNEIITDISSFDNEDVPPTISYGVRLASPGGMMLPMPEFETFKRKMRTQMSEEGDPDWTCGTDYTTTTLSQNSSIVVSHNHIQGMVSTDIYSGGSRAMFSVEFFNGILVYDASSFSIDNNIMHNTGGVFATFLDLTTSAFTSCGQGSTSFSNNVLVSAPLISNPYAQEDYWGIHLTWGLIVSAFEGRFNVDNNSITFATTGAGVAGIELSNGIKLSAYAEVADNSVFSVQGNTLMMGDTIGTQSGIQVELTYYAFTQSIGSSVRIVNNNVSMGCTQCRAIGITLDIDGGIVFTDMWVINDNIVDVRAPQDPIALDMAEMMYGSGGMLPPPMEDALKRSFAPKMSLSSSNIGNLVYFIKGDNDVPFAQIISVHINNNMITTAIGTSQFEDTSAIFMDMLVPQGNFEVKGNSIKMGIAGTSSNTGINVVGASGSIGSSPDMSIYISNFTTIDVSGNIIDIMNGIPTAIVVAPSPYQSLALGNSTISISSNTANISCDDFTCIALRFSSTDKSNNFTMYNSTFTIDRNTLVFTSNAKGYPVAISGGPLTLDKTTMSLNFNHFVFTPDASVVMSSAPHPDVYEAMTDSYRPVDNPYMSAICNTLQGDNIVSYDLSSGINVGMPFNETKDCPTPTPTPNRSRTITNQPPKTTTRTLMVPRTKTRTLDIPNTTTTTMAPNITNATTAPTTSASTTTSTTSSTTAASSMPTSASTTTTSTTTLTPTSAPTSTPTSMTTSATTAMTSATTTSTTTTTTATTTTPNTTTTTPTTVAPATCNTALAAQLAAEMPLFADFTVSMGDIQRGLIRTVTTLSTLNTSYSLLVGGLLASNGGRLRIRTVQMSIAGNTDGFSSQLPMATLTFINATTATINITALPSYDIAEDEALELSVETVELVGSMCVGTRLTAGRVTVDAEVKLYGAPSSIATTVISGGAAAAGMGGMSGMAAEQQALSALVMYSCSDPHSRGAFGSFRALSPFAIFESYAGVVLGNAIVLAVVAIIQAVVLGVMRVCRRVRRQVELMAAARFPSILMNVSFAFHTGTVYAASQLISLPDQFESWEVAVGAIAFTYCVLYPIFLCVHPYYRIGRAYQEYEMAEWLANKKWPAWIVHIVPQGAMYAPETRRAYGSYVSSYRAPASQVWWTSYPTWTSIIIGLGGLFHPDTIPKCQALFVILGLLFIAVGALCAWRAPLRSTAATYLNAIAKVLTALILFCLAASVAQTGSKHASNAVFAFGIIQTVVTIIRILHSLLCSYFDNKMASDMVPLSTTWTHVLGGNKKSTTQFATLDGLDLEDEASARDTSGDALLEMDDIKHDDDIVLEAPNKTKELHNNPDDSSSSSSSIADFSDKRSQSSTTAVEANPPELPVKDAAAAPQLASSTSQSSTTKTIPSNNPPHPVVDNLSISDTISRSNTSSSSPPGKTQAHPSPTSNSSSSSSSSSLSLSEDDML